jgi:L-alanine-DL-glutamate epimerase-like enolase superfamily enzyme
MKKLNAIAMTALAVLACAALASCLSTIESALGSNAAGQKVPAVTNAEAVSALRDALKEGIQSASRQLSAKDGYFGDALLKILLPPEAKPMLDSVGKIPQGQKLIDDVVLRLNRSAEEAAKDVVPIFVDAIQAMTIQDGIAIVKGSERSATEYLESKTRSRLFELYRPKVDAALAKPLAMDVSARKAWETLSSAYNKAGSIANPAARLVGKKEPMPLVTVDLAAYATNKALDGLFAKIGEEEGKIRRDPLGYASAMIKKVFGALKDGLL